MKRFFMTLLASVLLVMCTPQPVNPTPDADAAAVDAAPAPFGTYDCASWCTHAADMKCPGAQTTEHGALCVDVCKNTLDGPIPFNVQCRTLASSCLAADACENGLQAKPLKPDTPPVATTLEAPAAPATCAGWCAHALGLKCPAANRTPKGSSCVDVCNNVMSGPLKFNLKCRVGARTCALADVCEK